MRRFVGIDLGTEPAPDETTICKFRHLIEKRNQGDQFFHLVNQYLKASGLKANRSTLLDASIIGAPSSTKYKKRQHDPDMRQTKKGNQWYFGMKDHIGVNTETRLIHSVVATCVNVHDSAVIGHLLHGEEELVFGDSSYREKGDAINKAAPNALDFNQKEGSHHRKLTEAERDFNRKI